MTSRYSAYFYIFTYVVLKLMKDINVFNKMKCSEFQETWVEQAKELVHA